MQVVLTWRAELDLEQIGDHIAARSPPTALRFVARVRDQCDRIGLMPHAWPARPEWGVGVRVTVVGRYLMVHRVHGDVVQVLRILHGARDLERLFSDEPLPD